MKYFSTFTGIGGLDIGLEEIGAECVGFSEIKTSSIEIYKKHYPKHINFGDITLIDPKKLPDFDIFTGGFPCQSFSIAGIRKGFKDKRGQMIFYIYDILKEKKPQYVILENVKGILTHDSGRTFKSVFKLLNSAGYYVRVLLLNSNNYGSAQGRERVLFICNRKDFRKVNPEMIDNTKRFRDIRMEFNNEELLSEKTLDRLKESSAGFEIIGGFDKVNTVTTGVSSSGRRMLITQEENGVWRKLSVNEGELLQGFPIDWTKGVTKANRWYAIGNAVNCEVSRYLFKVYLKDVWGLECKKDL